MGRTLCRVGHLCFPHISRSQGDSSGAFGVNVQTSRISGYFYSYFTRKEINVIRGSILKGWFSDKWWQLTATQKATKNRPQASGTLIHCWWECNMVQILRKTVWRSLAKLNILLPYDPAIILLGIYPNELKTYVHTKICTQIFIAASFETATTWKQPKGPSVG